MISEDGIRGAPDGLARTHPIALPSYHHCGNMSRFRTTQEHMRKVRRR